MTNILEYKLTPNFLEIIAKSKGKANWYSLEQRMGKLKGYGEYPALYMTGELIKLGYINELPTQEDSRYPTFEITKSGLDFLEESKIKEMS
ncbi:hypothetical protein C7B62_04890 [Pleurocapsa sp. CCALA 161]|uniref:hypothetical protein n=1 Tax=Pleurocapsa sp. CCALA 161 TaxID=2107688 RepID=UPI000D0837C2|nr:hypothetical protein [Pleurocapsa sp. CCALA 161]PSB11592.1 hypothetical protein C7B62_04890 [Pleurocapsa sp. CCALA 161]